jgi:hypothetical protein
MDLWRIKQSKSVESDINILGATSPTVIVLLQKIQTGEKISHGLHDIRFYLSTRKREKRPQCVVCGEVLANNSFSARNFV